MKKLISTLTLTAIVLFLIGGRLAHSIDQGQFPQDLRQALIEAYNVPYTEKCKCNCKAEILYNKIYRKYKVDWIVGLRTPTSKETHSWIEWRGYILDPTFNSEIVKKSDYPKGYYQPQHYYKPPWLGF